MFSNLIIITNQCNIPSTAFYNTLQRPIHIIYRINIYNKIRIICCIQLNFLVNKSPWICTCYRYSALAIYNFNFSCIILPLCKCFCGVIHVTRCIRFLWFFRHFVNQSDFIKCNALFICSVCYAYFKEQFNIFAHKFFEI